jgi:hypothetical protein
MFGRVVSVSFVTLSGGRSSLGWYQLGSLAFHLGSYLLGAFGLVVRKPLLYPSELQGHLQIPRGFFYSKPGAGAGQIIFGSLM